jgi:cyclopropane fatty-acyl-phospholipid synthase-like methyltransferase
MTVLQPSEYDISYFDGKLGNPHPEGYFEYARSDWMSGEIERFLQGLNPAVLANKKVLELGCAKGFLVEDLRNLGVDAYGIDISQYAIDNTPIPNYVTLGDCYDLSAYSNKEFDWVYSVRLLPCLDPNNIPNLIDDIKRIAKNQLHIIDEPSYGNTNYYNLQTKENWLDYSWPKGTKIVSYQTQEILTK